MDGFAVPAAPSSPAPSSMVGAPTMLPLQSDETNPEQYRAARRGAGFGLLLAVGGTGAGFALGGPLGAGAGLLLLGSLRNALRATRDWRAPDPVLRQEAGTNAALALFGAVLGSYLGYQASVKRTGE